MLAQLCVIQNLANQTGYGRWNGGSNIPFNVQQSIHHFAAKRRRRLPK